MCKYSIVRFRDYIFIFLTATIFFLLSLSKSYSEENVFIVDNVKVEGALSVNFSREKHINKAFANSFEILKYKILLSRDLNKIKDIKLNEIRNLIKSFKILDETYQKDNYQATFKIFYNDKKVKRLLAQKNISFAQPKEITTVFFPILFVNGDIKNLSENYFYNEWTNVEIQNELINFILPLEDLDDISKIKQMENTIEELEIDDLVNKYDVKNYVFALMDYKNKKLNIHIKTNFKNNKMSKNISYELNGMKDESELNFILKDLKLHITDLWKEVNIVNLLMPLSIKVKFRHTNMKDLDKLRNAFYNISIIDNYTLEEFNIKHSFFKIYYYGNPKRLTKELEKFGYKLQDDRGYWELYINE